METRYYYTRPKNDETRDLFFSFMRDSGFQRLSMNGTEKYSVSNGVVSLNINPRITASITAPSKNHILATKSVVEQLGIKLVEKLF